MIDLYKGKKSKDKIRSKSKHNKRNKQRKYKSK